MFKIIKILFKSLELVLEFCVKILPFRESLRVGIGIAVIRVKVK